MRMPVIETIDMKEPGHQDLIWLMGDIAGHL